MLKMEIKQNILYIYRFKVYVSHTQDVHIILNTFKKANKKRLQII